MLFSKASAVRKVGIVFLSAVGALATSVSAQATEREVTRAGVEFAAPKLKSLGDLFGSEARGIEKPVISRAGREFVAPKLSLDKAAAGLQTGQGFEWARMSRAGIEYVPAGVPTQEAAMGAQVKSALGEVSSVDEIPHANRAGIVKHQPKFRSLVEFRESLTSTN